MTRHYGDEVIIGFNHCHSNFLKIDNGVSRCGNTDTNTGTTAALVFAKFTLFKFISSKVTIT